MDGTARAVHCRQGPTRQRFIPVSVWQSALSVFQAVVARKVKYKRDRQHHWLRQLVQHQQPTMWILARCNADRSCRRVDDDGTEQPADVQRVEVLRDIDWWRLDILVVLSSRHLEVRCRLVLRACPYLQHVRLLVDALMSRARHTPTRSSCYLTCARCVSSDLTVTASIGACPCGRCCAACLASHHSAAPVSSNSVRQICSLSHHTQRWRRPH